MRNKTPTMSDFKQSRGFALLESLISFIILAVGLLALLSFHGESQKNISEAKTQSEAVALAEDKLQELESFISGADTRLADGEDDPIDGVLSTFTRSWTVADGAATVTVAWNDRDGNQQQVVLSSDIFFRSPSEGVEHFLAVVNVANIAADNSGLSWELPGGGLDTGDNGGDGGDAGGDTGQTGGDVTYPPPEEPVTTYTAHILGTLSGTNLDDTALAIVDSTVDSENLLSSSCALTGNRTFSCTVTYTSEQDGWSGTVVVGVSSNKVICTISGATPVSSLGLSVLTMSFTGITNDVNVAMTGGNRC